MGEARKRGDFNHRRLNANEPREEELVRQRLQQLHELLLQETPENRRAILKANMNSQLFRLFMFVSTIAFYDAIDAADEPEGDEKTPFEG